MAEIRVLTTGEAAKYCGVNFRTIIRWIERGKLRAYKLPGRGDHRIREEDFVAFLRENDLPVPEEFDGAPRSVLVVEDNKEMASAISRVLRREGFTVDVAHDGFSAGAQLATLKPAVITLDLKMPGLDGYGVLRYIRSQEELKHLKVLVVSAETEDGLNQALDEGANAVLRKPFENDALVGAINQLLV
ncbi:response regulator [Halioxenophilus sp. WMMB6]|uniref:response regulator n=1 Tax=Halioxenophilus sp. WMMB6 TaxID=3073815 RepID=UPI00295E9D0C|nr:response regulator [Halioxenophilus sp. WMMB6]